MTIFLSDFYPKHIFIASVVSILFHLMVLLTYNIIDNLSVEEVIYNGGIIIDYKNLPQPSIMDKPEIAMPKIKLETHSAEGIPVPVPEMDVSPDQTIPTQKEMGDDRDNNKEIIEKTSRVRVEKSDMNIIDPDPEIFISVERFPVPVKQVQPIYPQMAIRTGVEGTVWVKILVDKDGKAKKAMVSKSDSEILNDSAIDAALEWLFTPAMMNTGPIAVWVSVPFRFKLKKD